MSRRSYEQFCGLAQALDRVGGRWTMLILRELIPGPARFTELQEGLPGIASNLLTERLRRLESDGLVRHRTLPPPASVDVYELTGSGRELEEALATLGRWGARFMPEAPYREPTSVRGAALAAKAFCAGTDTAGLRAVVDVDFSGDRVLTLSLDDGAFDVSLGPHPDPDATLRLDLRGFLGLATGRLPPSGDPDRISGDPEAVRAVEEAFARGLARREAATTG